MACLMSYWINPCGIEREVAPRESTREKKPGLIAYAPLAGQACVNAAGREADATGGRRLPYSCLISSR